VKIGAIVIRCFEFNQMLAFWQEALHYTPREPAQSGWVVLRDPRGRGPNVSLDRIPEKRTGKRSRLHLDLYTNNREAEVERLIKIGRPGIRGDIGRMTILSCWKIPTATSSASCKKRTTIDPFQRAQKASIAHFSIFRTGPLGLSQL
jgi:hypothetical protein